MIEITRKDVYVITKSIIILSKGWQFSVFVYFIAISVNIFRVKKCNKFDIIENRLMLTQFVDSWITNSIYCNWSKGVKRRVVHENALFFCLYYCWMHMAFFEQSTKKPKRKFKIAIFSVGRRIDWKIITSHFYCYFSIYCCCCEYSFLLTGELIKYDVLCVPIFSYSWYHKQ